MVDEPGGEVVGERDEGGPDQVVGDPFVAHRALLFTIAYEMLSSAADAEDVVQDAWLKWSRVDHAQVRDSRAYAVRVVTRTALDRMRMVARRREDYVGPWLPEPLLTSPDVAEDVALADSLSTAMLLVLETLTPTERAVFVLREVFELGYDELAEAVGKSEVAVRQIASRARAHVATRRPRAATSRAEARETLELFRAAPASGELQPLLDRLAPDVVALGDGGGVRRSLPRPVSGAETVGALLRIGAGQLRERGMVYEIADVNGWPALLLRRDGAVESVLTLRVDGGLVSHIYTVNNPDKLAALTDPPTLRR